MTNEECQKAMEECAWCVWKNSQAPVTYHLVKIVSDDTRGYEALRWKCEILWRPHHILDNLWCGAVSLHVATPNDMLKYGE